MLHIMERFFIHLTCSTFLTLAVFIALHYWTGRNSRVAEWISNRPSHLLVTSALVVAAVLPIREAFDLWAGQTWYKAVFDLVSWWTGAALSGWGLYRFAGLED